MLVNWIKADWIYSLASVGARERLTTDRHVKGFCNAFV